jgi:hypothetical protein
LNAEDAISLVEVANRFWIQPLKELATQFLQNNITEDNSIEILHTAAYFGLTNLHNTCMRFIENKFEQVVKTDGFLQTDPSLLMEIILSNNLSVTREEIVYESVMNWSEFDKDARVESLQKLLSLLRYFKQ